MSPRTTAATLAVTALSVATLAPAQPRSAATPEPDEESGVVITATRTERRAADSAVATEVISRADIEASGAENLASILEEHQGLDVQRSAAFGASLRIQGLDPQYTLILVDGQRVAGRINGAIELARFMAEDIERIEIVRGPSSALYGADALAGVINVISRRARRPWEGELRARYGALNSVDATARGALVRGPVAINAVLGFHRRDAFDLNPSDAATNGSAFDSINGALRAEWRPSAAWLLATGVEYFFRDQRAVDSGAGGAVFDRSSRTETLSVPLSASVRWGPRGRSRLRASAWLTYFRDQFLRDQRGSDALDLAQQTRNYFAQAEAQLDIAVGPDRTVTVGVDGSFELLTSERLTSGASQRGRFALYYQDEVLLVRAPRLALVPGFRLDVGTQFGVAPTPKLQARFDPHPTLSLRLGYGWGFRAPSFQELQLLFENSSAGYVVAGNPALRPERSRALDLSAEWRPHRRATITANFFRNDLEDVIDAVSTGAASSGEPTLFRYANVAAAWTMGVEAQLRVRPAPWLTIDASYTLTLTRDATLDRPLEGRAPHRATLSVQVRHPASGVEASTRVALVGPRPFYPATGTVEMPAYASMDLRAAWTFRRRLQLFLGCDNALDAGDARFLQIQPRTLYGGAALKY
jgi:outer membrane receptor for ferrienterochelin and colicins